MTRTGVDHFALGQAHRAAGRLDEAAAEYSQAIHRADARVALGETYLALGKFGAGWALFDERPGRLAALAASSWLQAPEWKGEDLTGKRLFVWGEQGHGDEIFAARYLSDLGAAAVDFSCLPALARLFSQLPVTPWPRPATMLVHRPDYWIPSMSLARWCAVPQAMPYLVAPPRSHGGIGIMWRGNALPYPWRSLPPQLGAELLALPAARSLDPEDTGATDFLDTAEFIAGLDLVITIDTGVAHLAGAMGKPTWVLLPTPFPDWRWREGESGFSLHYPSIKLIRQAWPGDWAPVVEDVCARLRADGLAG